MRIAKFPNFSDLPPELQALENGCGVQAAWAILHYFGKSVPVDELRQACHHNPEVGVYGIVLACVLREQGLRVEIFSQDDPAPEPIEVTHYEKAARIGVKIKNAISIESLLSRITNRTVPLVLFGIGEGRGHWSPFLGVEQNRLLIPYWSEPKMAKSAFLSLWNEPGVYRQCMLVSR